jgi:hypothetical protein
MKVKAVPTIVPVSLSSYRVDLIIIALLAIVTSVLVYAGGQMIDPVLLLQSSEDVWFGSDVQRVFSNMSDRTASNFRSKVHPLFSLLVFPTAKLVQVVLRVSPTMAVQLLLAGTTALWVSLLYIVLRCMGCRRFDATVFSILAWSSAAFIFWTTIPETYLFGSLSLLLPLLFVVLAQTRRLPIWSYVAMSAFSLSITTTNWMVGMIATVMTQTRRWAIAITGMALGSVLLLWVVQSKLFPGTTFITDVAGEANYILPKTAGGPVRILLGLFLHPMVIPAIYLNPPNPRRPAWYLMSVQHAFPGSGSVAGGIAVVLWIALLALGVFACWTVRNQIKLRLTIALSILGQTALHLLYGEETFLYAIHLIPFLLITCAMATLTKWRSLCLALAILLIVFAGWHNGAQFYQATEFLKNRGPLHQQISQVRSGLQPNQ